jgi:hypothetical protein
MQGIKADIRLDQLDKTETKPFVITGMNYRFIRRANNISGYQISYQNHWLSKSKIYSLERANQVIPIKLVQTLSSILGRNLFDRKEYDEVIAIAYAQFDAVKAHKDLMEYEESEKNTKQKNGRNNKNEDDLNYYKF